MDIIKYTEKIKHIDKYKNQGKYCKTQTGVSTVKHRQRCNSPADILCWMNVRSKAI